MGWGAPPSQPSCCGFWNASARLPGHRPGIWGSSPCRARLRFPEFSRRTGGLADGWNGFFLRKKRAEGNPIPRRSGLVANFPGENTPCPCELFEDSGVICQLQDARVLVPEVLVFPPHLTRIFAFAKAHETRVP
jgi:hypothetical protein